MQFTAFIYKIHCVRCCFKRMQWGKKWCYCL